MLLIASTGKHSSELALSATSENGDESASQHQHGRWLWNRGLGHANVVEAPAFVVDALKVRARESQRERAAGAEEGEASILWSAKFVNRVTEEVVAEGVDFIGVGSSSEATRAAGRVGLVKTRLLDIAEALVEKRTAICTEAESVWTEAAAVAIPGVHNEQVEVHRCKCSGGKTVQGQSDGVVIKSSEELAVGICWCRSHEAR